MKKLVLITASLLVVFSACAVALAQGYEVMPEDALIIPLGVEGTPYDFLEPGLRGGTMYISTIGDPKKWNHTTSKETSTTLYTSQMMAGLTNQNPVNGAIEPELAKSWDISDDGLVITFHLRRGIMWSDSEPFTADDVLFTFNDLIYNEDVDTSSRDNIQLPDDTFPVVEKVDDHTVKVTLSMTFRPILTQIGVGIMPKHKLARYVHKLNPDVAVGTFNETWGLDTDPAELCGLGPFIVESYEPDQQVVMRRNPYHYRYDANGTQLPYIDKYVILTVASQDVSLLKFRNGELDVFGCRPADVPILKAEEAAKDITVMVARDKPVLGTTWITVNQDVGLADGTRENLRNLFRNSKFRVALCHAMDKQTMINNLVNGLAVPQWSPVSLLSPFYAGRDYYGGPITETNSVIFEYDLDKAASLLDEIGIIDRNGDGWRDFEDGTAVEMEFNTNVGNTVREGAILIIVDDLNKIGLKAIANPIDFNTLVTKLLSADYDFVYLGLTGGTEPNSGGNVYRPCGTLHAWHYSACEEPYEVEKRIDELLDAGVATLDNDKAFEAYKEYQITLAAEDLGLLYTFNNAYTYVYYNYVGNAQVASPLGSPSSYYGLTWDLVFKKG